MIKKPKLTKAVRILLGIGTLIPGAITFYLSIVDQPKIISPLESGPLLDYMQAVVATGYLMVWIGLFKVVAAILLLIPKYKYFAAIFVLPFYINILLYTIFLADIFVVAGIIFAVLNLWLIYAYWDKYKPLMSA